MPFRFRRSARLGPLRFYFAKSGLSAISLGGRGASFNIPVARSGGPRSTVGLPGTGLSWSVEHGPAAGLPNSRRLLWDLNLITRLQADPTIGVRTQGLLAVIETPEALQAYLLRARSQDDVKRRAHRCVEAVQEAARLAKARGWLAQA